MQQRSSWSHILIISKSLRKRSANDEQVVATRYCSDTEQSMGYDGPYRVVAALFRQIVQVVSCFFASVCSKLRFP
eukprot:6456293-Amphidinium_carterae.1